MNDQAMKIGDKRKSRGSALEIDTSTQLQLKRRNSPFNSEGLALQIVSFYSSRPSKSLHYGNQLAWVFLSYHEHFW